MCDCHPPALKLDADRVVHCDLCDRQVVSKSEAAVIRLMRAVVVDEVERVLEHLGAPTARVPAAPEWIDPVEASARFGMEPRWYRDHGDELGGERRGSGPKPRWRFDATRLLERVEAMSTDGGDGRADGGDSRGEPDSR